MLLGPRFRGDERMKPLEGNRTTPQELKPSFALASPQGALFGKTKPTWRFGKTKPTFAARRRPLHASPISRRISAVCSPSRGEGRGDATGLPPIMIGVRTPGILPSLAAALASSSCMPRWITCGSAKT